MYVDRVDGIKLDTAARDFYTVALRVLLDGCIPFLVGGAFALKCYTGVDRHTKDFDVFVRQRDVRRLLDLLERAGFRSEVTFSHWLAKAFVGDHFFDVIYSSGNGLCPVDDEWFQRSVPADILGHRVALVPAEEMIWQKAFIMERERFDGADVNHLLLKCGKHLHWTRLLDRFGPHGRVLLSHLVLFSYVYPNEHDSVPRWVMETLTTRLRADAPAADNAERVCRGTFLSRGQYLIDIEQWDYQDARVGPGGTMTTEQRDVWTDAIPERQQQPTE